MYIYTCTCKERTSNFYYSDTYCVTVSKIRQSLTYRANCSYYYRADCMCALLHSAVAFYTVPSTTFWGSYLSWCSRFANLNVRIPSSVQSTLRNGLKVITYFATVLRTLSSDASECYKTSLPSSFIIEFRQFQTMSTSFTFMKATGYKLITYATWKVICGSPCSGVANSHSSFQAC